MRGKASVKTLEYSQLAIREKSVSLLVVDSKTSLRIAWRFIGELDGSPFPRLIISSKECVHIRGAFRTIRRHATAAENQAKRRRRRVYLNTFKYQCMPILECATARQEYFVILNSR